MSAMSRIVIDQQFATIGVKLANAQMRITNPRPRLQVVEQEAPKMDVETNRPEFQMDFDSYNAQTGRMNPSDLSIRIRNDAKGTVYQSINKSVNEGSFIGSVDQPGNRVAQVARQKAQPKPREINIESMPKTQPDMEWERGNIKVNWSNHNLQFELDGEYLPEVAVDPPYSIEIFLRDKPYFKITVEEVGDPYSAGQRVDDTI